MTKRKHVSSRPVAKTVETVDTEALQEARQQAAMLMMEPSELTAESLQPALGLIAGLPSGSAARLMLSLAEEGGEKALPLLERMAHADSTPLAAAAVEALGAVRSTRAAELLLRIAEADPNKELRKEAKRGLFRLRSLGIVIAAPEAQPEAAKVRFPIFRSILSSFDGIGTRAVLFGVQRPLGGADRIITLLNAERGLTDCAGTDVSRKALGEEMDKFVNEPEHGMLWADAPVSYCQQLVHDALSLNPKSWTRVPRGYFYWRDEIGQPAENYDRPLVYRELSGLEVKWDPTLLEQSSDLLDRHEFDSWAFNLGTIRDFYFELHQIRRSAVTLPGWSQKERQEAVMRKCFETLLTPEQQARYKFELEEMAYVFLRHDRRLDARRALAVAVALDDFRAGEVIRIPFMRGLLDKSFALIERELRGEAEIRPEDLGLVTLDQLFKY